MTEPNTLPAGYPGASPSEWAHLVVVLGLTADLLPVVSNQAAAISPNSKMKGVGKTPSVYNGSRLVVGIQKWTEYVADSADIDRWARERDYGACIQARRICGLDVDITDSEQAREVYNIIAARYQLPKRGRSNASKFLLAFECTGTLYKRKFKVAHGIIELLATGEQFVACGTHPSGVRYEWEGGLPDAFPVLTLEQVDALWADLEAEFAIEASSTSTGSNKAAKLSEAALLDPVAVHLMDTAWVKSTERDGRLHILCPWESEHTSDSGESATTYWPAHTGGYERGHFHCLHAHCSHREDYEFLDAVGYAESMRDEFAPILADGPTPIYDVQKVESSERLMFHVQNAVEFCDAPPTAWLIDDVMPQGDLAMIYGPSTGGKTFLALDMACAIAHGTKWNGRDTLQKRVAYVVAEGKGGMRGRVKAYCLAKNMQLEDFKVGMISVPPNLVETMHALAIVESIRAWGGADVVFVDTVAQTMVGNENSGEDMGRYLKNCRDIGRALGDGKTNALLCLIHHAGKDAGRGARGWSGMRAAADAEFEVIRVDDARAVRVTKQKDGEDGLEFGFTLKTHEVGKKANGKPDISCSVAYNDEPAPIQPTGKRAKKAPPFGGVEQMVWDALEELVGLTDGKLYSATSLVNSLAERDVGGRKAKTFTRALGSLIDKGAIEYEGVAEKPWGADGLTLGDIDGARVGLI